VEAISMEHHITRLLAAAVRDLPDVK